MTTNYIFDLDGTLTNAREHIDTQFKDFMHEFTDKYSCSICTGSDYAKVEQQLGKELTDKFDTLFLSSGNHVMQDNEDRYKSTWKLSGEEYWFLMEKAEDSKFFDKTVSQHHNIEQRIGCANFSVIARDSSLMDRQAYHNWDNDRNERKSIVKQFTDLFGYKSSAVVGGKVSIDIIQKGKDKAQILQYFETSDIIHFFGDKITPNGNDYTLAMAINELDNGISHNVTNWQETHEILQRHIKRHF